MDIDWHKPAPNPETLLILPLPRQGAIVAWRDKTGTVHGCRDVSYGLNFDTILSAWITDARKRGLEIEITAPRARHLAGL